jgi:hypothetical protein
LRKTLSHNRRLFDTLVRTVVHREPVARAGVVEVVDAVELGQQVVPLGRVVAQEPADVEQPLAAARRSSPSP